MKVLHAVIPGQWEDAYLYRGHLFAISCERTLVIVPYDELVRSLDIRLNAGGIIRALFERNDWLAADPLRSILAHPELAQPVQKLTDRWAAEPLDLSINEVEDTSDLPAMGTPLDISIYASRLLLAGTSGLWDLPLEFVGREAYAAEPKKRIDARCQQTYARLGAVFASCGSDGLHVGFEYFSSYLDVPPLDMVREVSLRSSWVRRDLVNYSSRVTTELLEGIRENRDRDVGEPDGSRVVVVGFRPSNQSIWEFFALNHDDVDFVYSGDRDVLIRRTDGALLRQSVRWHKGGLRREKRLQSLTLADRVIEAHETPHGVLMEGERGIYLVDDQGVSAVSSIESIVTRTFPRSRRYTNIICSIDEYGIHLFSPIELASDGSEGS